MVIALANPCRRNSPDERAGSPGMAVPRTSTTSRRCFARSLVEGVLMQLSAVFPEHSRPRIHLPRSHSFSPVLATAMSSTRARSIFFAGSCAMLKSRRASIVRGAVCGRIPRCCKACWRTGRQYGADLSRQSRGSTDVSNRNDFSSLKPLISGFMRVPLQPEVPLIRLCSPAALSSRTQRSNRDFFF